MSKAPDKSSHAEALHCPGCGAEVKRVHRHALDRFISVFRSVHRYRCIDPSCDWEGVVGREDLTASMRAALSWRSRLLWLVAGVALATAAMLAVRVVSEPHSAVRPAERLADAGSPSVDDAGEWDMLGAPPGLHHEGTDLHADDVRVVKNLTPLRLRSNCVWGEPGRTPYRGTVEQALKAAQLPPEVVRRISEMADNGYSDDRVEISRTAIRSLNGRHIFKPQIPAMGFGNTLCFNTQVNFPAGHVEYAALYEADDLKGRRYSVMVPYVCNNVSVLGVRREAEEPRGAMPEPASLALALAALGALGALTWLRGRTGEG